MTTHTDRIRQMAQEAGASFDPTFESVGDNPAFIMSPEQLTLRPACRRGLREGG